MNVFLDSTELFSDPFFKNYYHKLLLKICERQGFCIYISRVVLDETNNNAKKELSKLLPNCKRQLERLENLLPSNVTLYKEIEYSMDKFEKDFYERYTELEQQGLIKILNPDNSILPEIIERAIKGKKPFSEGKDEFRDCVIWLSYVNELENNNLDNCFLISNNTRDFYNTDETDLHEELKKDSNKFKLFKSIKEFISQQSEVVTLLSRIETQEWAKNENIDENYILNLINNMQSDTVFSELQEFFGNLQPYQMSEDFYELGNVLLSFIDIDSISDVVIEALEDEILSSGIITVIGDAEVEMYNPNWDLISEKYNHVGSITLKIEAVFHLVFSKQKVIEDFSLSHVSYEII